MRRALVLVTALLWLVIAVSPPPARAEGVPVHLVVTR